jgi:hypothetical protein
VERLLGVHYPVINYQRALVIALIRRGLDWQLEMAIPLAQDEVIVTKCRVI